MIKAILFDLDDTLLGNDIENFMTCYFDLLVRHAGLIMDPQAFLADLLICTRAMMSNTDLTATNRDIFWRTYTERNEVSDIGELEAYFDKFYCETFPQLQMQTERRERAAPLVQYCLDQGLKVVVATNPLFPRKAIEHRLAWAGLPVTSFPFSLVTTYSNMHSTKPHLSYYEEILEKIGCEPQEGLMVGDSWENDMVPAANVGLATYWIAEEEAERPYSAVSISQQGSLKRLEDLIMSGWLRSLATTS